MKNNLVAITKGFIALDRMEAELNRELDKLPRSLAAQVDVIMLDLELSRMRNERYLNSIAYRYI